MVVCIKENMHMFQEIGIRILLFIVYRLTDDIEGFKRKIQPEEMWLYRFPKTDSYYSVNMLYITIVVVPALAVALFYLRYRDKHDCMEASLGVSMSMLLTASVTNFIKLGVGRPRPDFLARCFPDGRIDENMNCTGNIDLIIEGYKSFPSGHSSCCLVNVIGNDGLMAFTKKRFPFWIHFAHHDHSLVYAAFIITVAFSSLGYVCLYVAGKLHVFSAGGRGRAWRLCCVVTLFVWATLIAVSRTADYHHHWQDVLVGSLLGMVIAYMCYHQSYPSMSSIHSHLTYMQLATSSHRDIEGHAQEWHIAKDGHVKHIRQII